MSLLLIREDYGFLLQNNKVKLNNTHNFGIVTDVED